MSPYPLYSTLSAIEIALSVVAFGLLLRARELKTYWPMLILTTWQTIPFVVWQWLHAHGQAHDIPAPTAYAIYFYCFWICFGLQALCGVILTYLVFREAMRPLKGLQQLGNIIYWWILVISIVLTFSAVNSASQLGGDVVRSFASEMQRVSGTLILSLVIFVYFAIRPMGLSVQSRVVGISAGLLLTSAMNTLQSPYLGQIRHMYRPYAIVQIATNCLAACVWIWYFSRPEPKRRFVLLATTSPFHAWNRIAEQFGAEPGFVAIGGVPPDAFAKAEMEVFHRASHGNSEQGKLGDR